jgi:predicted dehydrogenase
MSQGKYRCIMLGAGGMAGAWIRRFFEEFTDRMEIVALVDIAEDVLHSSGDLLELPKSARFTSTQDAFDKVDADFCTIVTPPWAHEEAVVLAAERGMPVLSEKPIADTWQGCTRIYQAAANAGIKMEVIQNYRYNKTMLTVRDILRSGRLGRTNYLMARFADDCRKFGSWGEFRHKMPHSLLVEGGVHHLDMLRNLAGSDCETIAGWEWNPEWSSFDGESNALLVLKMENGVRASYEGNLNEAAVVTTWHKERYRIECESGAVSIDSDDVVRVWERAGGRGVKMEEVPLLDPQYHGHTWQINEFLDWLDGGPEPDTTIADNIKSAATMFSAIVASGDNKAVNVADMVREATG